MICLLIIVRTPTVFLINPLAPRERLETLRTKKSLKLHKVACEQALGGALAAGREKEREVATTFLEFEFHLQLPCGSPSTELSDFRQSAFRMDFF